MKRSQWLCAGLLTTALWSAPALALDGMSVEIGTGDSVDMGRVGVQWDWGRQLLSGAGWHLGGYWDLALGQWHRGNVAPGQNEDITEIGFTPVFRLQANTPAGPYVEGAIGLHLMSHSSIGDKNMSTAFQFGDHVGIGYRFGKQGLDLSYRFQHLSNGGISHPNPGINFNQIRLQYWF